MATKRSTAKRKAVVRRDASNAWGLYRSSYSSSHRAWVGQPVILYRTKAQATRAKQAWLGKKVSGAKYWEEY